MEGFIDVDVGKSSCFLDKKDIGESKEFDSSSDDSFAIKKENKEI